MYGNYYGKCCACYKVLSILVVVVDEIDVISGSDACGCGCGADVMVISGTSSIVYILVYVTMVGLPDGSITNESVVVC